jgi:DNA-directed RNA polymerase specialized sigma24 family protein
LTFRYDPNGSFRSWLRRYCDSRLIDRLRERKPASDRPLDEAFGPDGPLACSHEDPSWDDELPRTERPRLLTLAAEIHKQVRLQVNPETWRAFWLVAVEDRGIRETAETLGKSYAATFAAKKRVRRMLREEGRRVLEGSAEVGSIPGSRGLLSPPA